MKQPQAVSEAVHIARIERDGRIYAETVGLLKDIAKNPVAELIIGFALIEKLQQRGIIGPVAAGTLYTASATIITAQQLAPLMPALAQGGQGMAAMGALLAAVPK